eukprot:8997964-Pyramimonas_sp.AAC.1
MLSTSVSSAAREAAEGVRQYIKAVSSKATAVDSKVTAHAQRLMESEQKVQGLLGGCPSAGRRCLWFHILYTVFRVGHAVDIER